MEKGQLVLELVRLQREQTRLAAEQAKLTRALCETAPARKGPQPERGALVRVIRKGAA